MAEGPADPVVGIGASAGGLAALKRVLGGIEPGSGAAYLVVQHLDPTHDSLMAPLLARATALSVVEAEHGARLAPDTVYTAPPGKFLRIAEGTLRLETPQQDRFQRTPIDHLFRQIGDLYGPRGVGVVLSGTGSDGTQGVRDVKAAGGVALAQEPQDAEFDGMPRAAIGTGLVDVVATADDLPRRLQAIVARARSLDPDHAPDYAARDGRTFREVLDLIAEAAGYNFGDYKPGTLNRRIHRRMGLTRVESLAAYRDLVQGDARERAVLVKDLLIGVTRFFRDEEAWEAFARQAIDPAIERLGDGDTLRAWAAGCATGEEAYTLAIVIHERIERAGKRVTPQIFATDLDPAAIRVARAGRYPTSSVADLSPARIERWFSPEDDMVRIVPRLRERLIFAAQNAISDPPFSRLDAITCRNLLIYLDTEAQKRLIDTFHFALREGGFLFLGLSESAERAPSLFETVDQRRRIYRRMDGATPRVPEARRARTPGDRQRPERDGRETAAAGGQAVVRAMLRRFAPPAVLVDESFEVQSFHGDLGEVLSFQSGEMTGSLLALVPEAWKTRLSTALQTARRSGETAECRVRTGDDPPRHLSILVEPVEAGRRQSFLVYFRHDAPAAVAADLSHEPEDADVARLLEEYRSEIDSLRAELQGTLERSETSHEELQAANEEVMSANEELQSSNEELETSREELQSLNEELTTINAELEEKVNELEATNDDLANLISSTDIATIFLDTQLRIRRYSARAHDLVNIRESDLGRPFADLTLKVDDPDVLDEARRVLDRLETAEADVEDGRVAYQRRIVPYRTRHDRIQGVVLTYADVTRLRASSRMLEKQARRQASIAELGELALATETLQPLLDRAAQEISTLLDAPLVEVQVLDRDGARFRLSAGVGWARGLVGATVSEHLADSHLGYALRHPAILSIDDFETETRFSPTELLRDHGVRCGVCQQIGPASSTWGIVCAWRRDLCAFEKEETDYLSAVANILWLAVSEAETRRLRESQRRELKELIDGLPIMIGLVDPRVRLEISNRAFERMGLTDEELQDAPLAEVLGPGPSRAVAEAMERAGSGQSFEVEVRIVLPAEGERTFLVHCAPRSDAGASAGHYLAAIDIHDRKMWEERNRVISDELDHRVKNILALVNTIARMTGRSAETIEGFREVFASRIASLSRTHSALAASDWTGMDLRTLVNNELEAYAGDALQQFEIDGPDVDLSMRASQSLALAIHELTTNAVKHGALADAAGHLSVIWRVEQGDLRLVWDETGLSDLPTPTRVGFGSNVVRNAVERQLRGTLDMEFRPEGLRCAITVPHRLLRDEETKDD